MTLPEQQVLLTQWKRACAKFDISVRTDIISLVTALDTISRVLAQNEDARQELGAAPSLWAELRKLWRDLARAQLTFWDADDSEGEEGGGSHKKEQDLKVMCASLAKFTRNLVAGVADNQTRAYESEPEIRRLLHYHTSWSAMEDNESIPVARILAQALSNMVTANEPLVGRLWETYMGLPEDQVILIRLLASPDPSTVLTALIFILNCIHKSRKRATMLARSAIGSRVCISLLDNMVKLYDAEEPSEGAQAFDVGYDILSQLIEEGLVPDLYNKFAIPDEIVTPHQTTLLKIVDSYLQSVQISSTSSAAPKSIKVHIKLSPMLAKHFFSLSEYAQHAVKRALRPHAATSDQSGALSFESLSSSENLAFGSAQPPPAELDVMLPKVCEALVLVTQCIVTITLEADRIQTQGTPGQDLKKFFIETRSADRGLVENLIELIRLFDLFLPRINFGKPVTGSSPASDLPTPTQQSTKDGTGFQYLKRDLVRLLGILCHGVKAVQDLVRKCEGIPVVMNLCVIDERNPYLREHAIFTLHGLLKDNPENQAIVDAIKSTVEWDENGVLKDTSSTLRK